MRRILLVLALIPLTTACKTSPSPQRPPSDEGAADAEGGDGPSVDGGDDSRAEGDDGEDGEGEGGEDEGGGLPGPTLPDGPLCDTDADCGAGMICEGVGCGPNEGRCVASDRICTRDLAQYCGCDGQTFQGSGTCPGGRYAYRGPCDPALEDGEPCSDGRQCKSGLCLGEGLEGCSRSDQGVCGLVACTDDLAIYCGCNNVRFAASGSCPNRQFAYRGPCEAG